MNITDEAVEAAAFHILLKKGWTSNAILKLIDSGDPDWENAVDQARAALTAALPHMQGWIKIEGEPDTSKAPWDGTRFWAYDTKREKSFECWFAFDEREGGWFWMDEADSEPNPTHWQPLPPAPVEGESVGQKTPLDQYPDGFARLEAENAELRGLATDMLSLLRCRVEPEDPVVRGFSAKLAALSRNQEGE